MTLGIRGPGTIHATGRPISLPIRATALVYFTTLISYRRHACESCYPLLMGLSAVEGKVITLGIPSGETLQELAEGQGRSVISQHSASHGVQAIAFSEVLCETYLGRR